MYNKVHNYVADYDFIWLLKSHNILWTTIYGNISTANEILSVVINEYN